MEEEPVEDTRTTRRSPRQEIEIEEEPQQQDSGGLGSIFGNMGIDLGNIGDIAGAILKSILLGGKSI